MKSTITSKVTYGLAYCLIVSMLAANATAVELFFEDNPAQGENEGLALGEMQIFEFSGWGHDDRAGAGTSVINKFTQFSAGGNFSGAGVAVHIDATTDNPTFGGTLQNGEVLRFSMWMASDPAAPLMMPESVIDVLKIEFYDTQLADPNANPEQKLFDTEQTAGLFTPFVDDLSTSEWRQFVFEYVVDDFDFDPTLVTEVRPVMFIGDFAEGSVQAGSMFVDRIRVERFASQSAADASPVDMTNPGALIPPVVFDPGDLNTDGFVDGLDLGILLGNFEQNAEPSGGELNGTDPVDGLDLGILLGGWNPPAEGLAASSVPEPTTFVMLSLAGMLATCGRRR